MKLQHYLISAGQKEILDGVSIRKHFKRIYASEYHFNHHGVATFPKLLVTDTLKTQFLFRINKGMRGRHRVDQRAHARGRAPDPLPEHDLRGRRHDRRAVDGAHQEERRPHGGGVRPRKTASGRATCVKLLDAGRVDFIAEADYRKASKLSRRVELLLDAIIADIAYRREAFRRASRRTRARAR